MVFKRATSNPFFLNEDVRIEGLSHDGRGIARYRGKTLFVDGALPDEVIRVQVTEDKRRFMNARAREILTASPERREPECRHFRQCGGCSLQYWSHKGQLSSKQQIVLDQLRHFANIVPGHIDQPLVSPPYGYRYRCRFAIRWQKGNLQLGFREKANNAICVIDHCPVLAEPLQKIPGLLKSFLPMLKSREAISHAECFLAENGRGLLLRHIRPLSAGDHELLREFAAAHQLFLYLQGSPERIDPFYPDEGHDALYYRLPSSGLKLYFRPQDFTQVNWTINQAMVDQAIEWLKPKPSDNILDLFCGLSNFSLPLARQAGYVTGVEGSRSSVDQATRNAELNGLDNLVFYQADLASDFSAEPWAREQYDAPYDIAVLDPPRAGADFMIGQLSGLLPDRLLYISCNPATLARDAGILASCGFRLHRLCVMDMFPQTAHVESMALFIK